MRTVAARASLRSLNRRGINIFAIAEAVRVPIIELQRLAIYGSALDRKDGDRLRTWAMNELGLAPKPGRPKKRRTTIMEVPFGGAFRTVTPKPRMRITLARSTLVDDDRRMPL